MLAHDLREAGAPISAHLFVPSFTYTNMIARFMPEKPAGAWTPEQTVDHFLARMAAGDFYILCPDNDVSPERDRARIAWAVGDITENRPALSRWHPDYADAFAEHEAGSRHLSAALNPVVGFGQDFHFFEDHLEGVGDPDVVHIAQAPDRFGASEIDPAVDDAVVRDMHPDAAPGYQTERVPMLTKLRLVATNVLPMGIVIAAVIGTIIAGLATPSESAAFGVLGVVVLTVLFRKLSWEVLRKSLTGTVKVTVMVFMIIIGSSTFSQLLAFSGASSGLVGWATQIEISPVMMLLLMFLVLLFLGMFLDQVSQMMLTLPVFMPLAVALGFDPIWFGVVMLLAMEISLTTPPFGLLLFVMLGVAPKGTTLSEVALAGAPYIICSLILLALLIVWPDIAIGLPNLVR